MIISDGFDTHESASPGEQLQYLKSVVQKVIWLNPMLGRDGIEPDIHFLNHVASHIDFFDSAEKAIHYIAVSGH